MKVSFSNRILTTAYSDALVVLHIIEKAVPGQHFVDDVIILIDRFVTLCDPVYCLNIK